MENQRQVYVPTDKEICLERIQYDPKVHHRWVRKVAGHDPFGVGGALIILGLDRLPHKRYPHIVTFDEDGGIRKLIATNKDVELYPTDTLKDTVVRFNKDAK